MNEIVTFNPGDLKDFNGVGDFFRVLSATDTLDVYFYYRGKEISYADAVNIGYWEEFKDGRTFDKVTIRSANAQTIQFATRFGSAVGYDKPPVGNVSVVTPVLIDPASLAALESTDLNSATIDQVMLKPSAGGAVANNAGGAAGAVLTVVAAAANPNGLWVTEAQIFGYNSAITHSIALIAKATAPANTADGQVLLHSGALAGAPHASQLNKPVFVAAGLGLHFYNASADSGHAGLMRACRWKLL